MFECIVKNMKTITSTRTQKNNKETSNIRNTTTWNRLYYDKVNFKNMLPYRNAKKILRIITEFLKEIH